MAFCVSCGKEMSDLATACPNCGHPNESLQPGVAAATGQYAGWGSRAGAAIIDWIVIGVPSWIIMAILGVGFAASSDLTIDPQTGQLTGDTSGFFATFIVAWLILMIAGILYKVLMEGSPRGQTVGKMVLKIRVRDAQTGGAITYGKAALRWFVGAILWILLYIPGVIDLLFPLWDARKQTLHDKAAGTIVVPA